MLDAALAFFFRSKLQNILRWLTAEGEEVGDDSLEW